MHFRCDVDVMCVLTLQCWCETGPSSPKNNHQPTNETKSTRKNAKNKIQEQKRKTMSITIEHPLSCRGHVTNRELLSASTVGMTTG
mmetsp:Transcript_9539/g.18598  ORF Transcript_9539/g.18598 Transcript_9539/m.18598 type:complete len:86 (-) Transcript_9539:125-382(-)